MPESKTNHKEILIEGIMLEQDQIPEEIFCKVPLYFLKITKYFQTFHHFFTLKNVILKTRFQCWGRITNKI